VEGLGLLREDILVEGVLGFRGSVSGVRRNDGTSAAFDAPDEGIIEVRPVEPLLVLVLLEVPVVEF
jgi:hypothetical protein